jgi:hypothetical protein
MSSLVFVHGTGVRKDGYAKIFAQIAGELRAERPLLRLHECLWGDDFGAKLHAQGASIPGYDAARAVVPLEQDESSTLWSMLYDDPLFELRLLGLASRPGSELSPGEERPGADLDAAVHAFQPSAELEALLRKAGLTAHWDEAFRWVIQSREYGDAIAAIAASAVEHRMAIARAVTADAIVRAEADDVPAPDGMLRDAIVLQMAIVLGGVERGLGGWVRDHLQGVVMSGVTRYVQRHRTAVSDAAFPAAGDILLYQRCGDAIRARIERAVQSAPEPVTLLAHSLGGIACVDLLAVTPLPTVSRLITVGSQAPFLYEIDALSKVRFGDPLPPHFPDWLNIYDPRDLLSFVVEPIAPLKNRARDTRDVKVDNDQPFPRSHSAYWTNPAVWRAILAVLP